MVAVRVPWVVRKATAAAIGPILLFISPINRDKPGPGFDEPASEQNCLPMPMAAIAVASFRRFPRQIECLVDLRRRHDFQGLLTKAVEPIGLRERSQTV